MWARVVEIMLGSWLLASLFIIPAAGAPLYLGSGFAVIIFGLMSFWPRTGWGHFLTFIVALGLIIVGYFAGHPSPPSAQNQIIVGILLSMFAIIPNKTNDLPESWEQFYRRNYE